MLPEYLDKLNRDVRNTGVLERFVVNYPDHDRIGEMRYHLARNYERSQRPDRASEVCLEIRSFESDSAWWVPATETLASLLPKVGSPIVLQEVLNASLPDSITSQAAARMDSLVAEVDSMEAAAAYLHAYPDTEYAPAMSTRLDDMAQTAFRDARLLEGVAEAQRALDAYHRILFVAPESAAAQQARERIDYLVRVG